MILLRFLEALEILYARQNGRSFYNPNVLLLSIRRY
jgi:hypothetical protein